MNRTRRWILLVAVAASLAFPFPEHEMNAGRVVAAHADPITVTGVLTDEGVECPTLRGDDGTLYTLQSKIDPYKQGDRVTVVGRPVEVSTCMQGTTLDVESIRRADPRPEVER